jgi:hypothetical protein
MILDFYTFLFLFLYILVLILVLILTFVFKRNSKGRKPMGSVEEKGSLLGKKVSTFVFGYSLSDTAWITLHTDHSDPFQENFALAPIQENFALAPSSNKSFDGSKRLRREKRRVRFVKFLGKTVRTVRKAGLQAGATVSFFFVSSREVFAVSENNSQNLPDYNQGTTPSVPQKAYNPQNLLQPEVNSFRAQLAQLAQLTEVNSFQPQLTELTQLNPVQPMIQAKKYLLIKKVARWTVAGLALGTVGYGTYVVSVKAMPYLLKLAPSFNKNIVPPILDVLPTLPPALPMVLRSVDHFLEVPEFLTLPFSSQTSGFSQRIAQAIEFLGVVEAYHPRFSSKRFHKESYRIISLMSAYIDGLTQLAIDNAMSGHINSINSGHVTNIKTFNALVAENKATFLGHSGKMVLLSEAYSRICHLNLDICIRVLKEGSKK